MHRLMLFLEAYQYIQSFPKILFKISFQRWCQEFSKNSQKSFKQPFQMLEKSVE